MDQAARSLYFGRDGAALSSPQEPAQQTDGERAPPSKNLGIKRKLTDAERDSPSKKHCIDKEHYSSTLEKVKTQVDILTKHKSWSENDLLASRQALYQLAHLVEEYGASSISIFQKETSCALVHYLHGPPDDDRDDGLRTLHHEVIEAAATVLERLDFNKDIDGRFILNEGVIPSLIFLLAKRSNYPNGFVNVILQRVADTTKVLLDTNDFAMETFRNKDGVPPLVDLLNSTNTKVKQAATSALLVLAYKDKESMNKILKCNPFHSLIYMTRHGDDQVRNNGVKLIEILASSSIIAGSLALSAGALQAIIDLLSDRLADTQRLAALSLGHFAQQFDTRKQIVQRGALKPLAKMLMAGDEQLQESSSYAFSLLAGDHNNAVAIIRRALKTLVVRLDSKAIAVQAYAARTLELLSYSMDNVYDIVTAGGDRKLRHGEWHSEAARNGVAITLRNLEENIHGIAFARLMSLLHVAPPKVPADRDARINAALALAFLYSDPTHQRLIFLPKEGELLEEVISLLHVGSLRDHEDAAAALYALAKKDTAGPPRDVVPAIVPEVYLGEEYVNSITMADVTFLIEGKPFYAHRNALCRASDAFRVMFESDYMEKNAEDPIEISGISWRAFELMIRYIYTGTVEIQSDTWQDLLIAADRYLVEGLKRFCANAVAQEINTENVAYLFEVAESCNAFSLMESCILFILQHVKQMCSTPGYLDLIIKIRPYMREYIHNKILSRDTPLVQ